MEKQFFSFMSILILIIKILADKVLIFNFKIKMKTFEKRGNSFLNSRFSVANYSLMRNSNQFDQKRAIDHNFLSCFAWNASFALNFIFINKKMTEGSPLPHSFPSPFQKLKINGVILANTYYHI